LSPRPPEYQSAVNELRRASEAGSRYKVLLLDGSMADESMHRNGKGGALADATILMLASINLNRDVERARQSGASGYLVKPIVPRDLLAAVAATLANRKPLPDHLPAETPGLPHDERALRILLAEDSEDNRVLIEAYLKNTRYKVDTAENGEIAVSKFTTGKYDLVLMDMQMPVMDGYTAARKIREWERTAQVARTPVVALTAYALKEEIAKSLEAGCDAHLSKPIRKRTLLEGILHATQNWRDSYQKDVAHVDPELAPLLPRFLERKRRYQRDARSARAARLRNGKRFGPQHQRRRRRLWLGSAHQDR